MNHTTKTSSTIDWKKDALAQFEQVVDSKGFPCIFGRNAQRRNQVSHTFVESLESSSINTLYTTIREYLERELHWNGRAQSAVPLIVHFSHHAYTPACVRKDTEAAWEILAMLTSIDQIHGAPPVNPDVIDTPDWSFSIGGVEAFVNVSSPSYAKRKSRNLGNFLTFVINPRERFDQIAGDNIQGRKARSLIRRRIEKYDNRTHSPELGFYGSGSHEWKQYALLDSQDIRDDECPYKYMFERKIDG